MSEFSCVAKREGLTWFIMFGTLLGASRQRGFIEWDDDVDVVVPRADYERLRLSDGWFSEPYFLQTPRNDPAAAPPFIRLRRSDTAVLINYPNRLTRGGNMGAYIDIIPLDDVPNAAYAKALHRAAGQIRGQMLASAALDECDVSHMPRSKLDFCYERGGVAGGYGLFAERYEKVCARYSNQPYYAMPALVSGKGVRVYDKEWFSESVDMEFSGLTVPAPIGWKEALIASYPDGILEVSAEERKKGMHTAGCVVDMNRSYKEYTARYTDMLRGIEGKRILFFGAGGSLEIWLERYGEGIEVAGVFSNFESEWGKKGAKHGLLIRPSSELPEMLGNDTRLIVVSASYKELERQLEAMGITDFYVFIDGLGYSREA